MSHSPIMFRFSAAVRNSLLALGAVVALIASLRGDAGGNSPPIASVASNAEALAAPSSKPPVRKDLLIGDLDLRGGLDLDKMHLVVTNASDEEPTSHYEVSLPDQSIAKLTLDPAVQKAADRVVAQAKAPLAAIVVMSIDGRILAMSGRRNQEPAKSNDYDLPLSVWAPAASVFKIITAASLLDHGVPADRKTCYHGGLRSVDKSMLVDNPRADTACNSLGFGLAKSQNALIAKLAHKHLSNSQLADTAKSFGFGSAPSFALDAESNRISLPADDLEFARVAAGFWSTEISALGGALIANVIASKGMFVTPRIVSEVRETTRVIPTVAPAPTQAIAPDVADAVAEMMTGTVAYGTAFKGFHDKRGRPYLAGTPVAGKTGSLTRDTPSYLAYSWFVGFAPADNPEVVISVLLANPPKWHLKAHTAARLVLESLY